jgi:hypothetical protein
MSASDVDNGAQDRTTAGSKHSDSHEIWCCARHPCPHRNLTGLFTVYFVLLLLFILMALCPVYLQDLEGENWFANHIWTPNVFIGEYCMLNIKLDCGA